MPKKKNLVQSRISKLLDSEPSFRSSEKNEDDDDLLAGAQLGGDLDPDLDPNALSSDDDDDPNEINYDFAKKRSALRATAAPTLDRVDAKYKGKKVNKFLYLNNYKSKERLHVNKVLKIYMGFFSVLFMLFRLLFDGV